MKVVMVLKKGIVQYFCPFFVQRNRMISKIILHIDTTCIVLCSCISDMHFIKLDFCLCETKSLD